MKTILIIDDEEDFCLLFSKVLAQEGYRVVWSVNPLDTLGLIQKTSPACVLLDILLGAFDGVNILRQIKTAHPHLPVIMISSLENVPTVVNALQAGASDYIIKSLSDLKALKLTIKKTLAKPVCSTTEKIHASYPPGISLRAISKTAARDAEKEAITQTLHLTHWNRGKAARLLKIDNKTLYNKIKSYEIQKTR